MTDTKQTETTAKPAAKIEGDPRDQPQTTSQKAMKVAEKPKPSPLDAFAGADVRPMQSMVHAMSGMDVAPMGAIKVAVYRNEDKIKDKLKVLAAVGGETWYYRFPVVNRKTGVTSYVEGPSIHLANSLARLWGNNQVDARVLDLGDEWMIYARFQDFETGYVLVRPFQQRKGQQSMKTDDDRQRDIALSIGVSKAERNVVTNALREFATFAFEEAKWSLVKKIGEHLPEWRTKVIDRFAEEKIDIARAERVVGRVVSEWTAPDVAKVIASAKAVTDGMTTWNDAFPVISKPLTEEEKKAADALKDFGDAKTGEGDGKAKTDAKADAATDASEDDLPEDG